MPTTTHDPFQYGIYTVKQVGEHLMKISYCTRVREAGWETVDDVPEFAEKGSRHDVKLSSNLARAKSVVRELVLCNPWDYWCTFTISPDRYDRYNLKAFFKDFSEFLHNYNRRCKEPEKVRYLLVPEQHKDGAWHLHGFLRGIRQKDLYTNRFGYLTWKTYEGNFGFISMSPVEDIDRASSYILKYMTKDSSRNVTDLNAHTYYASQGLERAVELYRGHAAFHGSWDWEHPDGYCKVKTIDVRKEDIHDYLEVEP